MDQNSETGKTPFKDKTERAKDLRGSTELVSPDKQNTDLSQPVLSDAQDSNAQSQVPEVDSGPKSIVDTASQSEVDIAFQNSAHSSPTFPDWIKSTLLASLSYPVVSALSLVSTLAALLTFVDFSSALLSPGGLEELYWLIQFSWLGLLFPSSLAEAIGVPWNDGIFAQFISAFFRCGFVMLVGGAVLCWVEILKNNKLSQTKKILWLVAITFSTLVVCPFLVPIYLFLHWLPEKRSVILQRWKERKSSLVKEDNERIKLQLAFIAILFAGLFGLGFAAKFPVGRLFG